jgi:3-oxoadipate enol-lactonase
MIEADGSELYFAFAGPDDAPLLVFCNALGATTDMWREQIDALSPRFRCLTYDANGHGRSASTPKAASIDALAFDLLGLLDAQGVPRATIVGASIGGMTAIDFAATYPDRVDNLILIGATPKMPSAGIWIDRAAEARQEGLAKIADAAMQRWFTAAFRAANPERIEEIREQFLEVDREAYARACEAIAAMDLNAALHRIVAPTLVIAGGEDAGAPPATAEAICAAIPSASMLVVPKAAHMMVIERAAVVSASISTFVDANRTD